MASCADVVNFTWTWGGSELADAALSATSMQSCSLVHKHSRGGSRVIRPFNLVLPPNSLPFRPTYRFSLQGSDGSSASVVLTMNKPPIPGVFSINLPQGTMMLSVFKFQCSHWVDDELPMKFSFGYISSSGLKQIIQRKSQASTASSTLPGDWRNYKSSVLELFSDVVDSLGASTVSYQNKVIFPITVGFPDFPQKHFLYQKNMFAASAAASNGNIDVMVKNIFLGGELINEITCSSILPSSCSESYMRAPCSSVDNTCGECLSGTVGGSGSHNEPCIALSVYRSFRKTRNATGNNFPSWQCLTDNDCTVWEKCGGNICRRKLKECVNTCSGHGSCTYQSLHLGTEVRECFLGDTHCEAVCRCDSGFVGSYCSITAEHGGEMQNSTIELLQHIEEIISFDKIVKIGDYVYIIETWVHMLLNTIQNPHYISHESLVKTIAILNAIVDFTGETGTPLEQLSPLYHVVDILLQRYLISLQACDCTNVDSDFVNTLLSIVRLLNKLNGAISLDMTVGEYPRNMSASLFRVSTVSSQGFATYLTLSTPQTALEVEQQYFAFSTLSMSVATGPVFSISELSIKLFCNNSTDWIANPVMFALPKLEDVFPPPSVTFDISLAHTSLQTFDVNVSDDVWSTKCVEGDFALYNHSCKVVGLPHNVTISHQCIGEAAIVTTQCPTARVEPVCYDVMRTDGVVVLCDVLYFDSLSTSCSCTATTAELSEYNSSLIAVVAASTVSITYLQSMYISVEHTEKFINSEGSLLFGSFVLITFGVGLCFLLRLIWGKHILQNKIEDGFNDPLFNDNDIQSRFVVDSKESSVLQLRDMKVHLQKYVNSTCPFFFKRGSVIHKIINELKNFHNYRVLFRCIKRNELFVVANNDELYMRLGSMPRHVVLVAKWMFVYAVVALVIVTLHEIQVIESYSYSLLRALIYVLLSPSILLTIANVQGSKAKAHACHLNFVFPLCIITICASGESPLHWARVSIFHANIGIMKMLMHM